MFNHKIYGDGIHDDTVGIQERIDSGVCELILPVPEHFYLISKPLELPSNFRLVLPRYAEVRLADGANCVMVRNKMKRDYAKRLSKEVYESDVQRHIWSYIDDYSPDALCENIELYGGIWNCNNQNQLGNPEQVKDFSVREFYGFGMMFYNVRNFKMSSLTVKDTTQYGIMLDTVRYFTVEDITFDYNLGNPLPINMDGVHLNGNCHFGTIRNLKGTCYDDMVALNAHEGSRGPISNIEINGLFAEQTFAAVRLLSGGERVENVHISNVFGSFYECCVCMGRFYRNAPLGIFDNVSIDHLYISKAIAPRKGDHQFPTPEGSFPLIYIQHDAVVKNLSIEKLHRREKCLPKDTVQVQHDAVVERLIIDDVTVENGTGEPMVLLRNNGKVSYLSLENIDAVNTEVLVNNGSIDAFKPYGAC